MVVFHNLLSAIISWLFPVFIPIFHIRVLWLIWGIFSYPVDITDCDCTCWDTVFKGPYEAEPTAYKHFYFNATENMAKIWFLTATGVIVLYESIRYLINLTFNKKLRFTMGILFLFLIFPHYYAWWSYINFYNDNFYAQWNQQLFLSATEMMSTGLTVNMANSDNKIAFWKMLIIMGVGVLHIVKGSFDQFIVNMWYKRKSFYQVVQELNFLIAAIFQIIIPLIELRRECLRSRYYLEEKPTKKKIFITFLCVTFGCIFLSLL